MNKVILIGNLTRDPELRQSQTGLPVCSFTLAVNRRSTSDHPEADYFRVTVWRQLAENCGKYLSKGKKVYVSGKISASAYMGNDNSPRASLDVTADEVEFLSPRPQGDAAHAESGVPAGYTQVDEEDLPY